MACRPQSNPRSTSSDGVPPELEVLGFCGVLCRTSLTGRHNRSDRSVRREPIGEDHVDDPRVLAYSSVLVRFCVNGDEPRRCGSRRSGGARSRGKGVGRAAAPRCADEGCHHVWR